MGMAKEASDEERVQRERTRKPRSGRNRKDGVGIGAQVVEKLGSVKNQGRVAGLPRLGA